MFQAYLNGDKPESMPEISWYDVFKIYSTCPAKWKNEEKPEQDPAKYADHIAILNPESFASRFLREPCAEDYAEILTSDADMKDWLKLHGVSGYSGKKYYELLAMIEKTGERPFILKQEQEKAADAAYQQGMQTIKAADFDRILTMRDVIFGNKFYADMLTDTYNDVLLCGELSGVGVRLRYDVISKSGAIIDYVGCTSAKPEEFMNQAERGGYYIKQAMLHDAFVAAYGERPSKQIILAQERSYPHIPCDMTINEQHLEIGRIQYQSALTMLKACQENNSWIAYKNPGEVVYLPISPWTKKRFGIEDK